MFSKKIALPMAAVAMASFVACDSGSSSSKPSNLTSCYIESAFFGSTCYEVSNVYADSVKANCLADGVLVTKASIGSGCPSGAVKSCEEVEDGVPGTAYYYGDLYKRMSCEELASDDDDEEEDPRDPNLTSCYIESAFFGSGSTCYEVSNVYADSVKANCLADGVFITKASVGSGCPSGAVKSCEEVEDGVPGTAYYYGDLFKGMSCEELASDDDDEEEDPRDPLNQDDPANNSNVGPEENEIPTVDPVENPVVEPVTPADDPVAEPADPVTPVVDPVDPVTPTDDPVVEPVEPVTPVADGPVCYMASDVPGMAECISITAEQCAMIMGEWVDACPIN